MDQQIHGIGHRELGMMTLETLNRSVRPHVSSASLERL